MEGSSETPAPEMTTTVESTPEVATTTPEISAPPQESSPMAAETPAYQAPEMSSTPTEMSPAAEAPEPALEAEDDSSYSPTQENSMPSAGETLQPEDESPYIAPQESPSPDAEVLQPEDESVPAEPQETTAQESVQAPEQQTPPAETLTEMSQLESGTPAADAIESINKPIGEQIQDTEKETLAEVSMSPEAQEALKNGSAADQGLVETVPPDIVAPVRTDLEEHTDADMASNESRIEGAKAIAARNTAANVEGASRLNAQGQVESQPTETSPVAEVAESNHFEDVESIPGHGNARHGADVTEAQQIQRLETGLTPDGMMEKPPSSATSFYSDAAQLEAVNKAVDHFSAMEPQDMAIRVGSDGEARLPRQSVDVTSDSPEGFGWGMTKTDGQIERVDNLNEAKVVMDYDPLNQQFTTPRTQYPLNK